MKPTTFARIRPYRVVVFSTIQIDYKRKGKKTVGCAFDAWNPELTDHWAHAGRLQGSGSFSWLGMQGAKYAAARAFLDPAVHQVQIRTEQDRKLLIFNRHRNTITSYEARE